VTHSRSHPTGFISTTFSSRPCRAQDQVMIRQRNLSLIDLALDCACRFPYWQRCTRHPLSVLRTRGKAFGPSGENALGYESVGRMETSSGEGRERRRVCQGKCLVTRGNESELSEVKSFNGSSEGLLVSNWEWRSNRIH
jgi:hypothetical protein